LEILERHVLLDGFRIVLDDERSRGSYLFNAASNSPPDRPLRVLRFDAVGYNHPHFDDPAVQEELARAATIKVAEFGHLFGGLRRIRRDIFARRRFAAARALSFHRGRRARGREHAQAAMDWKVRKNIAVGRGERGTEILHFSTLSTAAAATR